MILAVDPGNTAGYAVYSEEGYLQESGVCKGHPGKNFSDIKNLIERIVPRYLVVETQFFAPGRNSFGLISLVEARCVWENLCQVLGAEIQRMDPAVWHGYFYLKADASITNKGKRQKEFKERVGKMAQLVAQKSRQKKQTIEVKQNEADAILIGYCSVFRLYKGNCYGTL